MLTKIFSILKINKINACLITFSRKYCNNGYQNIQTNRFNVNNLLLSEWLTVNNNNTPIIIGNILPQNRLPIGSPLDNNSLRDIILPNLNQLIIKPKQSNIENEKVKQCPTADNVRDLEYKTDYKRIKNPYAFTHLIWVRHRKMKKHQRTKWRKKNETLLKKLALKKSVSKEKMFRAELLSKIKEAEEFDAEKYVKNILLTIDNMPKERTVWEYLAEVRELIRKNRKETNYIAPKFEDDQI